MSTESAEKQRLVQEILQRIASWLLSAVSVAPGWDELVLDIKPMDATTMVRITEHRGGQSYVGSIGPLRTDSRVLPDLRALQEASYDEKEGTWLTASLIIAATGWPAPVFQVGAAYNRQEDPQEWDNEGRLTARELRVHLAEFSRAESYIPIWMSERLAGRRQAQKFLDASHNEIPNQYLVAALADFSRENLNQSVVSVVRTLLGGDVLLDMSGSELVPLGDVRMGPKSIMRYQVIRLANGLRALCAFSSSDNAQAHFERRGGQGRPELLRVAGIKMLLDFVADETCQLVVIDPGTDHECFIEKGQAQWVLSAPRNDGVKHALMVGNAKQLVSALEAPGSILHMGTYPGEDHLPIFAPAEGRTEPDTILFFTSAPEISALDPSLHVQSVSTIDAFRLADSLGAKNVRLNALNPSATLPISQVREIVARAGEIPVISL